MSDLDGILADIAAERKQLGLGPGDLPHPEDIAKADFVKVMAPRVGGRATLLDLYNHEREKALKDYTSARPQAITDPLTAAAAEEGQKPTLLSEYLKATAPVPLDLGLSKPSRGDVLLARFGNTFGPVFKWLGLFEYASVAAATKMLNMTGVSQGLTGAPIPPKKDFSDYTWHTFMLDLGANDNELTTAIGLMSSMFLDPGSYLTHGASTDGKIGLKTSLSPRGMDLVNAITKDRAAIRIAENETRYGKLPDSTRNQIIEVTQRQTRQEILKRFGEINAINDALVMGRDVRRLSKEEILSKPGLKFEPPFTKREYSFVHYDAGDIELFGQTVLPGQWLAKEVGAGIAPYAKSLMDKMPEGVFAAAKNFGDVVSTARTYVAKKLIYNYGIDRDLVRVFTNAGPDAEKLLENPGLKNIEPIKLHTAYASAMIMKHEEIANKQLERVGRTVDYAFSGMTKPQQTEFMDKLITASEGSRTAFEKTGSTTEVKYVRSEDPVVQKAIDRWLGIKDGDMSHPSDKKPWQDIFADQSALLENKRLPIWVPGIVERYADRMQFKVPETLGESTKPFLKPRMAEDPGQYTRNPIIAIGYRAQEIVVARAQDKIFDEIVRKGLGGAYKARRGVAPPEGFAEIRAPLDSAIILEKPKAQRELGEKVYARKEFVEHYNEMVKNIEPSKNPLASAFGFYYLSGLAKKGVTIANPAFIAGNFMSNIVANALRIGGHAVDPVRNWKMAQLVMAGHLKEPKGLLDRINLRAMELVFGKNKDAVFKTVTDAKLSQEALFDEMVAQGLMVKGQFVADIGGYGLSKSLSEIAPGRPELSAAWVTNLLAYANPLSTRFAPFVFGARLNAAIETQAKAVNYLAHRMKGLPPRAAAMETNAALFDYTAITPFEKGLNRSWFLFYTWSKKNAEQYIKLMANRPGVINAQMKIFRDIGPTEEQLEGTPDWYKTKIATIFRGKILTGYRWPIEDVLDLATNFDRELVLRANPLLRWIVERWTGKHLKFDRPIEDVKKAQEFLPLVEFLEQHPNAPSPLREPLSQVSQWLELKRQEDKPWRIIANPYKLHLLNAMFTSRWQANIGALSNDEKEPFEKALQLILGFVSVEPNVQIQAKIAQKKAAIEMTKEAAAKDIPYQELDDFLLLIKESPTPTTVRIYMQAWEEYAKERSKAKVIK